MNRARRGNRRAGRRVRLLHGVLVGALAIAVTPGAAAQDLATLRDACFSRTYHADHLALHPGQRVAEIAITFQEFEDTLLSAVLYTLRYGTRFGFGGDCHEKVEGGFLCTGCVNDICESNGEAFKVLWSGGDTLRIVNDRTGMVAENPDGGRDYLRAGGEHGLFVLHRAAAEKCAW